MKNCAEEGGVGRRLKEFCVDGEMTEVINVEELPSGRSYRSFYTESLSGIDRPIGRLSAIWRRTELRTKSCGMEVRGGVGEKITSSALHYSSDSCAREGELGKILLLLNVQPLKGIKCSEPWRTGVVST